jgi:hypothetical protein
MNRFRIGWGTGVAMLLLFGGIVLATGSEAPAEGESSPAANGPMHGDPEALENAMVEAFRGALRDDVGMLATALERVQSDCRRLERDTAGDYGPLVDIDRGYHATLDVATDAAKDDDLSVALEQLYFVYVGCRNCHVIARKNGLLPNTPLFEQP